MPISHLQLDNFKSYGGSQVVGPFRDFTAIIGPNGAGKSNLMDAICFVLGLSAKSLRGGSLKDLIWKVEGREGEAAKQGRTASVTLVYRTSEDNEFEGVPAGTEVRFGRHITAEGVSHFSIDGRRVTLEAYEAKLAEINVVTKAKNFLVFQNEVEGLASKRPRELLDYFEVFAGSAELRGEYEELRRDKNAARMEFNAKLAKKKATSSELRAARTEKEEADKFLALGAEKEAKRTRVALLRLWHLAQELKDEEEALTEARAALAAAQGEESDVAASSSGLVGRLDASRLAVAAAEAQVAEADKARAKATTQRVDTEQQLAQALARVAELQGVIARLEAAARAGALEVADLEAQITATETQVAAMAAHGGEQGVALTAADRQEFNSLKAVERQRNADDRAALEKLTRLDVADQEAIDRANATVAAAMAKKADLQADAARLASRRAELEAVLARVGTEKAAKEGELATAQAGLEKDSARNAKLGAELEELKALISSQRDAKRRNDTEKRVEQAVEDMRRLFPGVRGRVSDLISPASRKYNLAVTVALGKHLDGVVVNSEATAFDAIPWLRENRIKPLIFLPLETVAVSEPSDKLTAFLARQGDRPRFRLLRDVVKFDPELERAVHHVCGSTVVAESLEDAKELRFTHGIAVKVVAVDGSIVAKNGTMTGGLDASGGVGGGAGANRFDERAVKEASERRDALLQEEELLRRRLARGARGGADASISWYAQIEAREADLAAINNKWASISREIEALRKRGADLTAECAACNKAAAKEAPDRDAAAARIASRKGDVDALQAKIDGVASEIFSAFSARFGFASAREFEASVLVRQDALARSRGALQDVLTQLRSKLEYEKSKDHAGPMAEARGKVAAEEARVATLREREATVAASSAAAEAAAATAAEALKTAQAALRVVEAEKEKADAARRGLSSTKATAAREVAGLESAAEDLRRQLSDMLLRARMEEIAIPMLGGRGSGARQSSGGGGAATADSGAAADGLLSPGGEAGKTRSAKAAAAAAAARGKNGQPLRKRARMSDDGDDEDEEEEGGDGDANDDSGEEGGSAMADDDEDAGLDATGASGEEAARWERVDYSSLSHDDKAMGRQRYEEAVAREERDLTAIEAEMKRASPNLKAAALLEDVTARHEAETEELNTARTHMQDVESRFADVEAKRTKLLRDAFDHVASVVDGVYKELTKSHSHPVGGTAKLSLETDAPFDSDEGGIRFSAMPPGKKFREIDLLSGGEKTVAALALLFSLHSFRPSPFFVLDEVDAALDNVNVHKVCDYLRRRSTGSRADMQAIVISLKDSFFDKAQGLVGICRDAPSQSSRTLTLDLTAYASKDGSSGGGAGGAAPRR